MTSQIIQPTKVLSLKSPFGSNDMLIQCRPSLDLTILIPLVFFWKPIIKLHRYVFIILHNKIYKIAVLQENKDDSFVCVCKLMLILRVNSR